MWNVPFNALSVLGGGLLTNEMTDCGRTEELCKELMKEVIAVAEKCGVQLPANLVEENIEYTRNFPPYKTSMLVDCENFRPVEADAIVGRVVLYGEKFNVSIPHLQTVYAILKAFDTHRKNTGAYSK